MIRPSLVKINFFYFLSFQFYRQQFVANCDKKGVKKMHENYSACLTNTFPAELKLTGNIGLFPA